MFNLALQILAEGLQPSAESPSGYPWEVFLMFGAVLVLGMFLMKKTQSRVARSQSTRSMPVSERVANRMPSHDIYSQIGELMAQLADLSRQINGQIDTRIAKLESLLTQADQTLARLENLPKDQKNAYNIPSSSSSSFAADSSTNPNPAESLRDVAEKFHQQSQIDTSPIPPSTPAVSPNSAVNQEIFQMHRSGMSAVAIARKMNRPIGEIELILALDNKKKPPETKYL